MVGAVKRRKGGLDFFERRRVENYKSFSLYKNSEQFGVDATWKELNLQSSIGLCQITSPEP